MNDLAAIFASCLAIGVALMWGPMVEAFKELRAVGPTLPASVRTPFSASIDALAVVRNRLVDTGCLDEPAKAAIEAVTHALISGTDK
jgi:hypothetical protein